MTTKVTSQVVSALIAADAWKATKYLTEKIVVTATRRRFGESGWTKRDRRVEILLKIGEPNAAEREFIAACKRAGESFPVRKVQIKARPKRRC